MNCETLFRKLREQFKIDAAEYMLSVCGNEGLRELSSPGKSGSVFYLSYDERYMVKTLRKSEVKVYDFMVFKIPTVGKVCLYSNCLVSMDVVIRCS